ncbi:hypothetical protein MNEG_0115 [Monoraphidium neglectum]|jgi:hypothetical protein|uniref:Uncharacterized protein n=1 Tax=Monoraphidium neglectum TaxID=145388 RepID=A0A0D2MZH9_9CHLO|nr:hypothetical protein MNEG_0115 [Monoraphidium neglectum]KIZ07825.1 hypothetical protein MNEG_0115 [Monoraphidium neglectum]|eukprot:XP_013906844.1 hypothetical protein MNEG_0115 [Monoraphidium neglectum]
MSTLSGGGNGGGGGPSGECQTVTQTSSSSCASGNCCEVKQRVTLCPKHTSALASINGNVGSCCVVLASKANGAPTAFCAAPTTKGGSQLFPSGVAVTLLPDCSSTPAGSAGSLTCTAFFAKLPRGYTLPPTRANLAIGAGVAPWTGELPPCGNGGYRGFRQTAVVDKAGAITFTSKCIA